MIQIIGLGTIAVVFALVFSGITIIFVDETSLPSVATPIISMIVFPAIVFVLMIAVVDGVTAIITTAATFPIIVFAWIMGSRDSRRERRR